MSIEIVTGPGAFHLYSISTPLTLAIFSLKVTSKYWCPSKRCHWIEGWYFLTPFSSANYGDEKRFVKRITSSKNENHSKTNPRFCSQESIIDPDLAIN